MSEKRYTRQVRLAEVGEAGQARLAAASVRLRARGVAAGVERSYLEAAGARVSGEADAPHLLPFDVRDAHAREVALGAHAALASLRAIWLGAT